MKLFTIQTMFATYATSAENEEKAREIFDFDYDYESSDIISISEVKPERLKLVLANEDIIFF